jgi:tRNA 2-selenouridine synthase
MAGLKVKVLNGGYKAYRHFILGKLAEKRKMIILGGLTGSSKTHIINCLRGRGNQVIDLEDLANHKGSAFGALGQKPQPSTEHFANMLYDEWKKLDPTKPVWLEDESRNIGSVFLPDEFYNNMQESPTIVLMMDVRTRMPRLLMEYSLFSSEELISGVNRISKRLGGDNTKAAVSAIESGDISNAIEISLSYYDKAYLYGLKKKRMENLLYIETDTDDIEANTSKVSEAAVKITV